MIIKDRGDVPSVLHDYFNSPQHLSILWLRGTENQPSKLAHAHELEKPILITVIDKFIRCITGLAM
ncbi:hypothetical protein MTR67_036478 [Solanum verrucosum]|uniref:Uncharacterized protein n=1 Tax=Solanum verrucosum TaxID=315347 RepID=A0AAF0UC39_SOLVR|nr:hypothetical protein MTR67_036478 [Solanum verrucosum]